MITTTLNLRVRYAETDGMGFAYHANYLIWFEMARVQMMDEIECPYRGLEEDGYRLPVLEAGLRYLRPATFDDRLSVEAVMREKPGLRMRIEYQVFRAKERIAEGFTRHAFINASGKPVRPPARFMEKANALFP